ncbi:SCO family protein [Bradyrhizobium sp. ISRA435]|nr:SCO family protein [Bradyrhizobium sp. ISRA435]
MELEQPAVVYDRMAPRFMMAPRMTVPTRRTFFRLLGAGMCFAVLSGCSENNASNTGSSVDISGSLPQLAFTMRRAADGREVTAADYRGKVVLLYFGYTSCPDICPMTLFNLTTMLGKLGTLADQIRVLFVTIDPNRDSLDALKQYTSSFAPQIVGLRGTPDQLAALAKRYRVAYSVKPIAGTGDYEVTHGTGVYLFDREGNVKRLFAGLERPAPRDLKAMTQDVRNVLVAPSEREWFAHLLHIS